MHPVHHLATHMIECPRGTSGRGMSRSRRSVAVVLTDDRRTSWTRRLITHTQHAASLDFLSSSFNRRSRITATHSLCRPFSPRVWHMIPRNRRVEDRLLKVLSKPTEQAARSACRQSYRGDKYYLKINECLPTYLGPLITDLIVRNQINGFEIHMRSLFRSARCDVRSIHYTWRSKKSESLRASQQRIVRFECLPVVVHERHVLKIKSSQQCFFAVVSLQFNEKKLSYRKNIARRRSLHRSRSFTNFGTNRMPYATSYLWIMLTYYLEPFFSYRTVLVKFTAINPLGTPVTLTLQKWICNLEFAFTYTFPTGFNCRTSCNRPHLVWNFEVKCTKVRLASWLRQTRSQGERG